MRLTVLFVGVLLALIGALTTTTAQTVGPNAVHVTILHLNDCYELNPAGGTDLGGVARVASLRKWLRYKNSNTFTMLAGDLFAPSALSTVKVPSNGGKAYNGVQMVAGMNAIGVDVACLGNHEVDVSESAFDHNVAESNFPWLSANIRNNIRSSILDHLILKTSATATQNRTIKIGVVGLTIDTNNKDWLAWQDFNESAHTVAKDQLAKLQAAGADFTVALTHFNAPQDEQLANSTAGKGIGIIVGGHEHTPIRIEHPGSGVPGVFKADSNVRSVWVHDLWIDVTKSPNDPSFLVQNSELLYITSRFADDIEAKNVTDTYVNAAYSAYAKAGFNCTDPVAELTEDWDLRGSTLQSGPTFTSSLFAESLLNASQVQFTRTDINMSDAIRNTTVDFAVFNVGAFRLDDVVEKGTILTEYDLLRIVPFPNLGWAFSFLGRDVERMMNISFDNQWGRHGNAYASQFLAYSSNLNYTSVYKPGTDEVVRRYWYVRGEPLDYSARYAVSMSDYLSGGPHPYEFIEAGILDGSIMVLFNQSETGEPNVDPRNFFLPKLREILPPPAGGDQPDQPLPPEGAGYTYANLILRQKPDTINLTLLDRLKHDLQVALQIRQARIHILEYGGTDPDPSTGAVMETAFDFSFAPPTGHNPEVEDPVSADAAQQEFISQANDEKSLLRALPSMTTMTPGSAAAGRSPYLNAAMGVNGLSQLSIITIALMAILASRQM